LKEIAKDMKKLLLTLLLVLFTGINITADEIPTISPTATYEGKNGEEEGQNYSGTAPLDVRFKANTQNADGWTAYYEWRFTRESEQEPYLIRYEENTEYTFLEAGSHSIVLYAVFTQGENRVEYTEEYWSTMTPIKISISESMLEMPNAFSPNGDDKNNIFKAKKYQSIVEFDAYIYNRWGQKLYEWHDPAGGWDGTYKGKDVAQGVYYVLVKAKGADGRRFTIKRDVNLLRGYTESNSSTGRE